jgi:hypothetical protein
VPFARDQRLPPFCGHATLLARRVAYTAMSRAVPTPGEAVAKMRRVMSERHGFVLDSGWYAEVHVGKKACTVRKQTVA